MKSHSWNISNPEGETLLEKLLLSILHHQSKMTIGEIGTKLKEKAIADKIMFYRDGKRRNINQYIRTKFSGIYNFISSRRIDISSLDLHVGDKVRVVYVKS